MEKACEMSLLDKPRSEEEQIELAIKASLDDITTNKRPQHWQDKPHTWTWQPEERTEVERTICAEMPTSIEEIGAL